MNNELHPAPLPDGIDPTAPILDLIGWALHECLCSECGITEKPTLTLDGEFNGEPLRLVLTAHVEQVRKPN